MENAKAKPEVLKRVCTITACTTVVHNTVQSSSDNLPSQPLGNHHSSVSVCWTDHLQLQRLSFAGPNKAIADSNTYNSKRSSHLCTHSMHVTWP